MPHAGGGAASGSGRLCARGAGAGGGAESAILRTWPDNDDSGLNDDGNDDDSEGNVHWPQAESGEREREREPERSESRASQLVAKIILMTAKRKKL